MFRRSRGCKVAEHSNTGFLARARRRLIQRPCVAQQHPPPAMAAIPSRREAPGTAPSSQKRSDTTPTIPKAWPSPLPYACCGARKLRQQFPTILTFPPSSRWQTDRIAYPAKPGTKIRRPLKKEAAAKAKGTLHGTFRESEIPVQRPGRSGKLQAAPETTLCSGSRGSTTHRATQNLACQQEGRWGSVPRSELRRHTSSRRRAESSSH